MFATRSALRPSLNSIPALVFEKAMQKSVPTGQNPAHFRCCTQTHLKSTAVRKKNGGRGCSKRLSEIKPRILRYLQVELGEKLFYSICKDFRGPKITLDLYTLYKKTVSNDFPVPKAVTAPGGPSVGIAL